MVVLKRNYYNSEKAFFVQTVKAMKMFKANAMCKGQTLFDSK